MSNMVLRDASASKKVHRVLEPTRHPQTLGEQPQATTDTPTIEN